MKTNKSIHTSEARAEQVASAALYLAIYLGIDLHKQWIVVTRIIDHSTPQPAQRLSWPQFWRFLKKQTTLAQKVYAVYEAGAFGFWPCRQMTSLGIHCLVMHPEKLDPRHKRVQTDKLDSRHLADRLQRYVLGNRKAMVTVYVPTVEEEQQRLEARHRCKLHRNLQALRARGKGLLLSQGIFANQGWWKPSVWARLKPQLSPQLVAVLEDHRALIQQLEGQLHQVEKQLEAAAPAALPVGMGKLTFMLLIRELCNYRRFAHRRQMGGFTGLCGAVSSSGAYHLDLSINKAGNPYLRGLLIELAWRMLYWQPGYTGLAAWRRLAGEGGSRGKNRRRRKIALVAIARQLAVDLWRWQTGRVTPAQLGWKMNAA